MIWSQDEYADEYWDPNNRKVSTCSAYRKAIDEGYDYAVEVPTDFIAENTDLMIFHALKKFRAFKGYDPFAPIQYTNWEEPLVRTLHEGKTTGIYTGCPVGKYRLYVIQAIRASISDQVQAGSPTTRPSSPPLVMFSAHLRQAASVSNQTE